MSLNMDSAHEFVNQMVRISQKANDPQKKQKSFDLLNSLDTTFKLGQVDAAYSGSNRPSIVFEGEAIASAKKYPYLSSYTPVANDIVLLCKVGKTYVILGSIQ